MWELFIEVRGCVVHSTYASERGSKEEQKLRTLSTMCTQGGGRKGSKKPRNYVRTMYTAPRQNLVLLLGLKFRFEDCVMQVLLGARLCY